MVAATAVAASVEVREAATAAAASEAGTAEVATVAAKEEARAGPGDQACRSSRPSGS